MQTYMERVNRFRLVRHTELPAEHKAEYRLHGIDPDEAWSLIWSFETRESAEAQLANELERKSKFDTWKIVDAGSATEIERPVY